MYAVILGPPGKPMDITVFGKTQSSITVGWKAGLNGGSEQYFKVIYQEMGHDNWKESKDHINGLKTGESANYTINGLDGGKEYKITVVAINGFKGRSESQAEVQTVKTEGKILTDDNTAIRAGIRSDIFYGLTGDFI